MFAGVLGMSNFFSILTKNTSHKWTSDAEIYNSLHRDLRDLLKNTYKYLSIKNCYTPDNLYFWWKELGVETVKGTVMQIEKVPINDRLRVSKLPWKSHIPTIYNFAVICKWYLFFS